MKAQPARIAIVGPNFAGIAAARHLSRHHAVTLLDPKPAFEFLPNIHELVSGVKRPAHLQLSRETLSRRTGHHLRQASVTRLHTAIGQLELAGGDRLAYDACVVACGGVNTDFGIPGVQKHTLPFKSVDECVEIGDQLALLAARGRPARVVIIGGSFEGIECLGEILRRYRDVESLRIHLVEAASRLMPQSPASIDAAVREHCAKLPVSLHCGVPVSRVSRTRVTLADGTSLRSDLTLWTAGAAPAPLLFDSQLAPDRRSWAPVNDCLQSIAAANVFIAGDAAATPRALWKQAYNASAMGSCAADNVERWLADRPLRPLRPMPAVRLTAFGDIDTFLEVGERVFAGPTLAALKETIFQLQMAYQDNPLHSAGFLRGQRRYLDALGHLGVPALLQSGYLLRRGVRRLGD